MNHVPSAQQGRHVREPGIPEVINANCRVSPYGHAHVFQPRLHVDNVLEYRRVAYSAPGTA